VTTALDTDVAIVGSGFGGSILAMVLRRLGRRVMLLERATHPRFAIGESASPLLGVVLEQIADRYDLPRLRPLGSYGAWKRHHPEVICGMKRGFTYFKQERGEPFSRRPDRANELFVAASPSDELSDTHWLRSSVDHFLVNEATAKGAEYLDRVHLDAAEIGAFGVRLRGTREGAPLSIRAGFVVDATGPRGFLSRALGVPEATFPGYPGTQALFSHFTGVARCDAMPAYATADLPPYPMDDAALHHVFDGGWMWLLRFDNGVTSAGVSVTDALADDLKLADGEPAWHRLLARFPSVREQFVEAVPTREFTWMPRVAWRSSQVAGERWAMLPSAASFVDPLFSTGMPQTLLGIERLARVIDRGDDCRTYADTTLIEADHTARFVAGCFAGFPDFARFTAYSMFYFAAASFSEMSRRLHGDGWSRGFLCVRDETFANALRVCSPAATEAPMPTLPAVARAIAPLNVAGLADPAKANWYGVDVEETAAAAGRLGVDADAVRRLFASAAISV